MGNQAALKSKAFLHPIRSQLYVLLHSGSKTAQELCELMPGVPAGSVYRHLNILLEAGLIVVSEEVKQRGAMLRRFSVNTLVEKFSHEEMDAMDHHAVVTIMQTMLAVVESKGQSYLAQATYPLAEGEMGMMARSVHMTDEEYQNLRKVLINLYEVSRLEPREGTSPRFIGYFSFPEV